MLGLGTIGIWLFMAVTLRYSSLSALVAAAGSPVLTWVITQSMVITISVAFMAILLIWRHKKNIQNLLSGKEDKIGSKKK